MNLFKQEIILASTSPRRQEVLRSAGVKFKVVPSDYEEKMIAGLTVVQLVQELARGKVAAMAKKYPSKIIIGADTLVTYKNKIYGKPKNIAEAKKMLRMISGRRIKVYSGVAVACSQKLFTDIDTTYVNFKKFSTTEIDGYIRSNQPMDKAGAFGVQGLGLFLIDKLDGNYSTVMGLPMLKVAKLLNKLGISIF